MKKRWTVIILAVLLFNSYNNIFQSSSLEENLFNDIPKSSDIAGTDLYSESIDAYVAGNKSIIKQSLFTNDTSILPQFDTRDPAFYKCNLLISASNGIIPSIFPRLVSEENFNYQYDMSFNGFSGFLYYDEELSQDDAQLRADRAFKIIKEKFEIDIILLNVSNPNFFPFVGHYPDWNIFLDEITRNIPEDGYWKALDIERLKSKEYQENYHLSSAYFLINTLDILEKDIFDSISQVNFNINSLDFSYLENLEIENIFSQFFGLSTAFGGVNETIEGFESFNEIFTSFSLSNESHYTSVMVQYEGYENAIEKLGNDEYSFSLWKALGYHSELRPSEKIFIALIGAFMSEINVNILASDIIDNTPKQFTLYDFLLEQLQQLFFYADIEIDIETLKDYVFELVWIDNGGIKQSYMIPKNYEDSLDYINFLPQLGFQGISGILTGLFNPVLDLTVNYRISNSEPNLLISKDLINGNASNGALNEFDFNITVRNVGNESAWGVPTHIPISLDDMFTLIAGPLSQDLMDAIWEVVRIEYPGKYESLEDFFNFDEDPRIFYFDSLGSGLIDKYLPNLGNLTNLFPYNEDMENVMDLVTINNPQLISGLLLLGVTTEEITELLSNKNSIWNAENWFLERGEIFSYIYSNFSIANLDSFTSFYRYNFTIKTDFPELPSLISGVSLENTDPKMALLNDNKSWILGSQEKYIDYHEIDVQFLFQNDTSIDLLENEIDRVSILINYTDPFNTVALEIFNFTSDEFIGLSPYLDTFDNRTFRYSFIKNEKSLEWLFDPYSRINHSIVLRMKGSQSEPFNVSINNLDIEFSKRDVNHFTAEAARVIYSSESGNINYLKLSNTISLSTHEMASIITNAELSRYYSKVGEENIYILEFENIGSQNAYDINFTINNPGLIRNEGNFTRNDSQLTFYLDELAPLEKGSIQFSFYTPNSILIQSLEIKYNSTNKIKNLDSFTIAEFTNDIFLTAKVDYISIFPFLNSIKFEFDSLANIPSIGEHFNITLKMKNDSNSKLDLSNFSISLHDDYGDLKVIINKKISISGLNYNESLEIPISLKKVEWKGYYFGPINYIDGIDNSLVQISNSVPIIIGNVNLTILKQIDKTQIEIGQTVQVNLTVRNKGNICIKNLVLSDVISFTQIEFSLVEGSLIHEIECLLPGESLNFSYKIKAKSQNLIRLKSAFISFYFLRKNQTLSNEIQVKIIIPTDIQAMFIIIPSAIASVILIAYVFEMNRYKFKKFETQRNENLLFKTRGVDSIIKVENRLKEYLRSQNVKQNLSSIPKEGDKNE